jgi:hypothetical protein
VRRGRGLDEFLVALLVISESDIIGAQTACIGGANQGGMPGDGWSFRHSAGTFVPVEIGYRTSFNDDQYPRQFDVGGYYDSSNYDDPFYYTMGGAQAVAGSSLQDRGRSGVWVQAQQMVYRPDMQSHRGLTLFAQAVLSTSGAVPINNFWQAGLVYKGPFARYPHDTFDLVYQRYGINQRVLENLDAEAANAGNTGAVANTEQLVGSTTGTTWRRASNSSRSSSASVTQTSSVIAHPRACGRPLDTVTAESIHEHAWTAPPCLASPALT